MQLERRHQRGAGPACLADRADAHGHDLLLLAGIGRCAASRRQSVAVSVSARRGAGRDGDERRSASAAAACRAALARRRHSSAPTARARRACVGDRATRATGVEIEADRRGSALDHHRADPSAGTRSKSAVRMLSGSKRRHAPVARLRGCARISPIGSRLESAYAAAASGAQRRLAQLRIARRLAGAARASTTKWRRAAAGSVPTISSAARRPT